MPQPVLVSIIIRSMGRSTLSEALDSIARQTYPHIEAVVVNALGAGHPAPGEGCGRFPLYFVDTGRALDRSAAANAGLDAAHGEYLGFLDDDDLLFPEHVSVLADALRRSSTARVAYGGVRMIAYQPDGAPCFEVLYNQPFHRPSLRAQNYIPMHAVLFERTLLAQGCRFDESLAVYEDWDFWLQLAEFSDFIHVDRPTACYRNFGYSGFGLQADTDRISAGRAALFEKWRKIWSGADLSEALAALRDRVIHQPPTDSATQCPHMTSPTEPPLDECIAPLEQASTNLVDDDQRQPEALRARQRQVDDLAETLEHLRHQLAQQSRQIEEVYGSTSWRITQPLRGLARAWRRWRHSDW